MGETRTFIRDVEVHPAALLFPEMEPSELDELAKDISEHGVRVPLTFLDGRLIDGRNRMRACVLAGIPSAKIPRREAPSGTDPFLYSWSLNAERRHLTPSQRAAIRLKVMEFSGEEDAIRAAARAKMVEGAKAGQAALRKVNRKAEGTSAEEPAPMVRVDDHLAKAAGVSDRTARKVMKIRDEDPKRFEELAAGRGDGRSERREKGRLPLGHPLLAKRKQAKNWSMPRAIPAMAAFLRERLTSTERLDLARLLAE